jgi:cellulose synthase/poly-beta-1,6-N-acetylglucosamine synthase-like glycosyltransferase
MQAVEYITSQNLDRRAFEILNSIAVVPGAIGAWRAEAVNAAGGLSSDTLAEDADLTFGIIRAGYRVVYEEDALAMTQAPQGTHQFFRQRLRWSLGMLQTAWKHRAALREARPLGFVAIPNIVLFGILLSLLAPLADIVFVAFVLGFVLGAILEPTGIFDPAGLLPFLLYALFLSSDVLLAAVAFGFEPREPKRLLWWTLLQRFFYRQMLNVVVFRAVYYAFSGRLVGWRKVLRTIDGPPVSAVDRADRRVIDLKWEGDDRRRWNRRAMDLNPVGPERRERRSGIKPPALGKG